MRVIASPLVDLPNVELPRRLSADQGDRPPVGVRLYRVLQVLLGPTKVDLETTCLTVGICALGDGEAMMEKIAFDMALRCSATRSARPNQ